MTQPLNIGEAAAIAGVSSKMIRHYEQIGLISPAQRSESGYRQYSDQDVAVLRFIKRARVLGFSIEQIAELLSLWSHRDRHSREVKSLATQHLHQIEEKLQELTQLRQELTHLIQACHGNDHPDCAILDRLGVEAVAPLAEPLPKLKKKPTTSRRVPANSSQENTSNAPPHALLMAWMRPGSLGVS
ncbi:MAG TPA: Cu(I)-responsive transcriptional regulator [Aquabacterium sp.]|nr:Cu(I)-responsive transcriptional regulator [Aquabacterium sp.]